MQIDSQGLSFAPTALQIDSAGLGFSGTTFFQVDSAGILFSGAAYGITPSTVTPESGEVLVLAFSGDPDVPTVWRVVSMANGVTAPLITTGGNLIGYAPCPAVKTATAMVIGGKQGTAAEKQITVTIAPTPHGYYTAPGVWVPAHIRVYT